jgi:hypothetical protein
LEIILTRTGCHKHATRSACCVQSPPLSILYREGEEKSRESNHARERRERRERRATLSLSLEKERALANLSLASSLERES